MKRIMIVGQPGSGKSTSARQLGQLTGLPVVHIDLIHWMPGWVERPKPEKIALANEVEAQDAWIFEGGLSATWETRASRAEMLVVLDMALGLRCWRVFWRTIRHWGKSRPDLPAECPERFDREFWLWIWNTRNVNRRKMLALAESVQCDTEVHVLTSRQAVRTFLAGFRNAVRSGATLAIDV